MRAALYCIFLAAAPAFAQSGDGWNFLSDASILRDVHGVLPAYLKDKAEVLLNERQRRIAGIATMADLTARRVTLVPDLDASGRSDRHAVLDSSTGVLTFGTVDRAGRTTGLDRLSASNVQETQG